MREGETGFSGSTYSLTGQIFLAEEPKKKKAASEGVAIFDLVRRTTS